jgi:hypothetical protein
LRNLTITTDLTKQIAYKPLIYKQYDSEQMLNVEFLNDGQKYPLTDHIALAYFKMPDKPIEQRNCTIMDNVVSVKLDSYLLGHAGNVPFEIEIRKENEITSTFTHRYMVERSFDANEAITTEPHWDVVSKLLDVNVENYATKAELEAMLVNVENGLPVDLSTYPKKSELHPVATSGKYTDLIGKPTKLSQFQNDLQLETGGGSGGGTVINGSGYGVLKSGDNIISAPQANAILEIEGNGIEVELINKAIGEFNNDRLKLTRTPTHFEQVLNKPFNTLSSDFIVDDNGMVTIDRNRVGGSGGGGMPFINITNFKVYEDESDIDGTSFGALGDKFTSGQLDTLAFERAFRLAKDNGSVNIYIPDGNYILNQTIQLYPNTNVQMSRNAVIRKNHDNPMFSNSQPNEWFLGYSGRGKIFWQGGTLDCKDASGALDSKGLPKGVARSGSTFSLVNAEYFEFKSMIFLDQKNTHHFDLSGIRNIVLAECYFYGYTYDLLDDVGNPLPVDYIRAYSECIQIDYSSHQAMPSQNTGHDGTACQFVFVQRCKFDKSDMYPSWNRAVGMHNVYFPTYNWLCNTDGTLKGNNFNFEYSKAKNMYITDNEIYGNGTIIHDYFITDGTTGEKIYDPQGYIIQQIRLLNVDNVYISGNKFEDTKGGISFDCDQSSKTMIDTDAERDFNTKNSGHLMPYSVEWTDNRGDSQKILYSDSTSDKGTKVTTYTQYGKTYKITWAKTSKVLDYYGISNCHVINNTFKNITAGVRDINGIASYQPSTPIYIRGECRTKSSTTLQGTRANKVIIMGNIVDGIETVPVEIQSRLASSKGLSVAPAGTTGGTAFTPNIVSAISATYTRNITIIGNEIRNCSRAIYTSGCNRGLIANNQIFTIVDTEAIGIVGGGIYLITGNIMDNMYDSAIRMKGTDQFFVEGNIITNPNKGATWTIDVPFFQYNPRDKATIWVEVDGSGGSNYGSVSNNKIYSSFTSNFIKYPIYIGSENTYVKSAGNFYFGTYQFDDNVNLNFSDCGLDTAFRGNDAETLNGKSFDTLKDTFVQHTDKGILNGVASLDSAGKIPLSQMPTAVTSSSGGFKQIILPPVSGTSEVINATSLAPMLNLVGEGGISFDALDGNILKIKYDFAEQVSHIASNDLAIDAIQDWQENSVDPHMGNSDIHVTKNKKDAWDAHLVAQDAHVTSEQKTAWENHKNNGSIHVTQTDKNGWDTHVVDNDRHVTAEEQLSWNNHLTDTNPHVTTEDKTNWNGKANATDVDIDFLKKTSSTKQTVSPEVQFDKNVTLTRYEEKIGTATNGACDLSTGSVFIVNVASNTDISLINPSYSANFVQNVIVYIKMEGTFSVTFPAWKWHNQMTPTTLATGKTYEFILRTIDGGNTWFASQGGVFT